MKVTTILPVSRTDYLDRVLESLLKQTKKTDNLLVIFDGTDQEFIEARNKIVELDIDNIICISSNNPRKAYAIPERRIHIVNNHNQAREVIQDCDFVFSIEDDGVLPENALERLYGLMTRDSDAGMATGVELGRWGVPYVGAWKVDDPDDPKLLTSMENKCQSDLVEEIDACGLFCALIRSDLYKQHEFFTHNGLGPDVNLGLFIRQQGYKNYIDWNIPVTHITSNGFEETEIPATSRSRVVGLRHVKDSTWQSFS